MNRFHMTRPSDIAAPTSIIRRVLFCFAVALLFVAALTAELRADTFSKPLSVVIPTGMDGQLSSAPVSVVIPTGIAGQLSSKPVSVAIPVGLDGEIISHPVIVALQPANIGDSNQIGLWHMDGDWGDSSGSANHGLGRNGAAFSTVKKVGSQSGAFDGSDDFVFIESPNGLDQTTHFTLCAWVYAHEAKLGGLVNCSTESDGVWELWYEEDQSVRYRHNWSRTVDSEELKTNAGSVPLNTWVFVSLVYTDHEATLYVNGQVAASTSFENNPLSVTGSYLEFGCNHAGDDEFYNGLLDEIALYTRALTIEEITGIYNRVTLQSTPPEQPVVNAYPALVNSATLSLSGSKEADTSLWVKGIKKIDLNSETAWQLDVPLEPGPNLISFTARNQYGIESDPAIVTVIRDEQAPTLVSSLPADGAITNRADQVTFVLDDNYAEIDPTATTANATLVNGNGQAIAGAWSADGGTSIIFTPQAPIADGHYIATIFPTDSLGNQSLINIGFTLDSIPPSAPTFDPVDTVGGGITLQGDKSADTVAVVFSATSGTVSTPIYPSETRWQADADNLQQGETTFSAYALDRAGNKSEATTLTLQVDITPPAQPGIEPFTSPVATETITLMGSKEAPSRFFINGWEYSEFTSTANWIVELPLSEGENTFYLVAADDAGNLCEPLIVTVIRDNSAPVISNSVPAMDAIVSTLDDISVTLADQYSAVDFSGSMATAVVKDETGSLIEGAWSHENETLHFVPANELEQGLYRVQLSAMDAFGNSGPVLFSFRLDRTASSVTSMTMTPPSPHKAETVTFQFNFNEKMDTSVHPLVSLSKLRVLFDSSYYIVGSATPIPTVGDDFSGDDGAQPQQQRWQVLNSDNSRIQLQDGALRMTIDQSTGTEWPRLVGKWKLAGDFDIRIDYALTALGGVWGDGIGLQLNFDDGYFVRVARGIYSGDQFRGLIQKAGSILADNQMATADSSGILRITRNDTLLQCWYASSAEDDFIEICQATVSDADTTVELAGRCGQTDLPSSLDAVLDNFALESGTVVGFDSGGNTGYWIDNDTWQGTFTFTEETGDGNYEVIIAGARDQAGNTMAEQTLDIFTLDTVAPEAPSIFNVTTPTRLATQILHGSKPEDTAILINGSTLFPLGQLTAWEVNYPLSEGENTLTVTAADAAGNQSLPVVSTITLDTTPPTFTIDSYQMQSANASQLLSGRKEPGCSVTLNDELIIDTDDLESTWSHEVTLNAGVVTRCVFVATDSIGNSTTRSVDLIYDEDAPSALASGVLQADGNGRGTEVYLSWPAYIETQDIAYYRVYYSTSEFTTLSGLTAIGTAEKGGKAFTVGGLSEGITYYFAVEPVDTSGNSEQAVFTTMAIPVDSAAPENVRALAATAQYDSVTGNSITLTWTASIDSRGDLAEQIVYMDGGSGYDAGIVLGKEQTSYTVSNLNDATHYKFKVSVRDGAGHESSGSIVEAVTRLDNPTGLTLVPGKNKINLTWQAVDSTAVAYYKIYRLQSSQTQTNVSTMAAIAAQKNTSYLDTALLNGVTYQYAVTVVNTSGAENTVCESLGASPREDTGGPVISLFNLINGQIITTPMTLEIAAADAESALQMIELYIDGERVAANGLSPFNYFWNIVDASDGNHTVKVIASDSLGNLSEESRSVIVSLSSPATPSITSHTIESTAPTTHVALSGTAPLFTTVTLKVNGAVVGQTAATQNGTFSFTGIAMVEGRNVLTVKASHRGGDSPYSANYPVVVDTGAPPAPVNLSATAQAGGRIQLSWQNGAGEIPSGYNVYTAPQAFTSVSQAGVSRVNTNPIGYMFYQTIPAGDEHSFYAVSALDAAEMKVRFRRLLKRNQTARHRKSAN